MRYLPITGLKEGMTLARPIYGAKLEVLLAEGLVLSAAHIQRINQMGYAGVYIQDSLSMGIEIEDIIPERVRLNTIHAAKEMWQQVESGRSIMGKGSAKMVRAQQDKIVMPLIESLIGNPNRLVELIDLKPEEQYLYYHAANGAILSVLIGVELGLSGTQIYELALAALLHDIGTIFVPKALLDKPGKLMPEEFDIIKSHTEKGFDYLRENFEISIEGCMGALQHHEFYDGSGYPSGLKKDRISIFGRIIAITDVYDALTSRRPYRRMLYPPAAMDYLNAQAGIMFDPEIVSVFQRVVPLYPSGLCVELDSGVRGVVVRNYVGDPARPAIRTYGGEGELPPYIDLHNEKEYRNTHVARILE